MTVRTGFHVVNDSHPRTVGSSKWKYRSFIKRRPPAEENITSHNGGFSVTASCNLVLGTDGAIKPRILHLMSPEAQTVA